MKRSVVLGSVTVIGLLLATGSGLAWWKYRAIQIAASQPGFEPAQTVSVVKARTSPWHPTAKLLGSVFATQSIVLSNELRGVVTDVKFDSGSIVEKGDVLLVMDTSQERADLAAAEASVRISEANMGVAAAQLREAESAVRLAESDVGRYKEAVDMKAAAPNLLDKAKADLDRARAQVSEAESMEVRAKSEAEQARAKVNQLDVMIKKKTLLAPFRSRVGIRNVHPGQYLAEGTSMVELQGIAEETYLDFAIPQDQAFRVMPGQVFMATSEAFGPEPLPIKVIAVDAAVDRATRNVRIRSLVPNPNERLRPGTYVEVEVPLAAPKMYVVLPDTAVRRASYGDHVFLVVKGAKEGEFRAKQKFVKLGPSIAGGSDVIVTDGLNEGDEVAASGSFKLRDGALVMKGGAKPAMGEKADAGR